MVTLEPALCLKSGWGGVLQLGEADNNGSQLFSGTLTQTKLWSRGLQAETEPNCLPVILEQMFQVPLWTYNSGPSLWHWTSGE